ncbi:MAG: hypothetical protein IT328_20240 [Caldilineaceae bacterium]|nr:hypothetical protein [Caldilineaceae bacterium]
MLPVEQGSGQIWQDEQFLCDIDYDIDEPLVSANGHKIQRVTFTVAEADCAQLLDAYGLTLVIADGRRCAIPRPLQLAGLDRLECYVES